VLAKGKELEERALREPPLFSNGISDEPLQEALFLV
jgi:hypothetical protein